MIVTKGISPSLRNGKILRVILNRGSVNLTKKSIINPFLPLVRKKSIYRPIMSHIKRARV